MKKIIMYPHGGSSNHGCEAIVRCTMELLGYPEAILFSDRPEEDYCFLGSDLIQIQKPTVPIKRFSTNYLRAFVKHHFAHRKDAFDEALYSPILTLLDKNSVLLSIGGDNYCYGDNEHLYLINRNARRSGTKTVLWGCSIEPQVISQKMISDLRGYDMIVARESVSYQVLSAINSNTVLYPDPAFTLQTKQGILPAALNNRSYIGFNISPTVCRREPVEGIVMDNSLNLIDEILNTTEYDVALIPHVNRPGNSDYSLMKSIKENFVNNPRIQLIVDQNCMRLKDIISHCRMFMGARTHATIAAYSSCVPTVVIGYSTKAKGIATDLFGTDENFVLPVQMLKTASDFVYSFHWLQEHELAIRSHLLETIPSYTKRAYASVESLSEVLFS